MNARYHYLGRTCAGSYPARFAVLSSINSPGIRPGENFRRLECAAWHLKVMEFDGTVYRQTAMRFGRPAREGNAWPHIMRALEGMGMIDLWIPGALRTLAATGWYQAVMDGHIMMRDDQWHGSAIISNPPVMIVCRPTRGKGAVRILCLGNIGVETPKDLCLHHAHGISWYTDYADELNCPVDRARALTEAVTYYLLGWYRTIVSERLGSPKATISSQAWGAFRHRFMRHPVACHADNLAHNLEFGGTFSGRAECFRIGHVAGPLYCYDVRSCYATLLRGCHVPCRLKIKPTADASRIMTAMDVGFVCIADVTLRTDQNEYPCRRHGRVIWPTGTFRTVLCGDELISAMTLRPAPIVHRWAGYETDRIFDDWIEWSLSYRRRCQDSGNAVGDRIAKLMIVSLLGRFGKRAIRWRNMTNDAVYMPWQHWIERNQQSGVYTQYRSFGWLSQELVDEGYDREAVPIITAFVTSLGRAYLWKLMCAAGRENVIYTATDSIIVTNTGRIKLERWFGGKVAMSDKLKLSGVYDSIDIRGINHYRTAGKRIDAGVPHGTERGDDGVARWDSVEALIWPLKRYECPNNRIVPAERSAVEKYAHGRVDSRGYVTPYRLKAT